MRTGTVGVMTNEMLKSRVTKMGPSQWVLDGVRTYKTLATAAYALGTEDSYPAQVWGIIMALDEVGVDQDKVVEVLDTLGHDLETVREILAQEGNDSWKGLLAALDGHLQAEAG